MKNLQVKLEIFEGPFDLLLKLIDKNKIDIYNIPISKLTDDYLSYVKNMVNLDMNETSEFILMATMLLEIKSKMLLPKDKNIETNEEIDPREELVKKLVEYKKYKLVAETLATKEVFSEKVIFKKVDIDLINSFKTKSSITQELIDGLNLDMLYNVFKEVLKRKDLKKDYIRSGFKSVTKSLYNVKDKMQYIKDILFLEQELNFKKILEESNSKIEIVVTFLAILELIKEREIKILQQNIFSEIIIFKGEN